MPATFASWGNPRAIVTLGGETEVIFTNSSHSISLFRELGLQCFSLTHNSGTPNLELLWSDDDGGTWLATGYNRAGVSAGTSSFVLCSTAAATPAAYSAAVVIYQFNVARQSWVDINGGRDNSATGTQVQGGFQTAAAALSGVRIRWSSDTPILAGAIYLYGKQ